MTQEDKQLLLKDICGRLPYRLKVQCDYYPRPVTIMYAGNINEVKFEENGGIKPIQTIKPYLRPMSSMTEEEKTEWDAEYAYNSKTFEYEEYLSRMLDWLNKYHFDYRGLIEKGLALEAPEGMYKAE